MVMFLRWQIFSIYGALLLGLWITARKALWEAKAAASPPPELQLAVDFAPVWGILVLGIYAVSWIAFGVVTLKDDKNAAKELEQDVKEAKEELRRRGILKDS